MLSPNIIGAVFFSWSKVKQMHNDSQEPETLFTVGIHQIKHKHTNSLVTDVKHSYCEASKAN